jgi:hypothetical protein
MVNLIIHWTIHGSIGEDLPLFPEFVRSGLLRPPPQCLGEVNEVSLMTVGLANPIFQESFNVRIRP